MGSGRRAVVAGLPRRLQADRHRETARLVDRVEDGREIEEEVLVDRPITLDRALPIGIPRFVQNAERIGEAPAVRHRGHLVAERR